MKYLWFERGAFATKKARSFIESDFEPSKVHKIAVIRHAALGDQVITRPFLIEARQFFPNAEITLVGVSNYTYGMPSDLVDRTLVVPGKEKRASFKEKLDSIKALGEQDIIFDLASTNRSHWMVALSKAKIKVGFPYKRYLCGTLFDLAVFRSDFQPEVECMLDMLRLLGHNPKRPLDFGLPKHNDLKEQQNPFILYFNGASHQQKILAKSQCVSVLKAALVDQPDFTHIYLEGKNDYEKAQGFEELLEYPNFKIQPCLPLEELTELIASASLMVAPDTGVRNIAVATHTPTVGIFYSTVPFRYTPQNDNHHIVMNPNGDLPSVEQITLAISEALRG